MIAEKPDPIPQPPKKPKFDQLRADHELFLQAFEKPTQIYRFLRTRNAVAPVFLHRNLSYMKNRRTTRRKLRKDFEINSMLEKVENETGKVDPSQQSDGFLNITFASFFFGSGPVNGDLSGNKKRCILEKDFVNVEVSLVKVSHKRRKDNDALIDQLPLGQATVPFNPRSQLLPASASGSISVPNSTFKGSKNISKTCVLTLQVSVPYKIPLKAKKGRQRKTSLEPGKPASSVVENGSLTPEKENGEPPTKRQRIFAGANYENMGEESDDQENTALYHTEHAVYTAELIMFDKKRNCLLTDGDYELALQEKYKRPGRKRGLLSNKTSWENVFKGNMGPFEVFAYGPTLKFKLSWCGAPVRPLPRRPTSLPLRTSLTSQQTSVTESSRVSPEDAGTGKDAKKQQVVYYQFIYNSHTRQQTEARDDFYCPWCHINCYKLYNLLKHLKLCHGRFTFTYAPHSKGARIDVCVNEHYDGSYAGRREEFNEMLGYAFSREGPCRRVPFTKVMAWRPQGRKESLSEFLEPDDNDFDGNRPYHIGHDRMYFHASTCLPVRQPELSVMSDSEEEENPCWMKTRTIQMIDEFTDVNNGEKDLMKLWNLHLMEKGYVADSQVYNACCSFLDVKANEIIEKNLKRNFIIHLVSLHDFNLINAGQILQLMNRLREATCNESSSPAK